MRKLGALWRRATTLDLSPIARDIQSTSERLANRLLQLSRFTDVETSIFPEQVLLRLQAIDAQLKELSEGRLIFRSTESWRPVYERLISDRNTKRYWSVALIQSEDYWRDVPGENSLKRNYELVAKGLDIRRVFLIDDFLWPQAADTPSKELFRWIAQQHHGGIQVGLLRLSAIEHEPDLICDMGIYGDQAVGFQTTDNDGKTVEYELCFSVDRVREAIQRWQAILSYAVSLSDVMDISETR